MSLFFFIVFLIVSSWCPFLLKDVSGTSFVLDSSLSLVVYLGTTDRVVPLHTWSPYWSFVLRLMSEDAKFTLVPDSSENLDVVGNRVTK